MKFRKTLVVLASAILVFAFVGSGMAKVTKDDTQMLGKITNVSGKTVTIETIGEKTPQKFTFTILDNAMILRSDNGKILKVADLKPGSLVNVYVWRKGDDLFARWVWLEAKEDYLTKAILKDAKEGKYYKDVEP